jgi:hypothetical protein
VTAFVILNATAFEFFPKMATGNGMGMELAGNRKVRPRLAPEPEAGDGIAHGQ